MTFRFLLVLLLGWALPLTVWGDQPSPLNSFRFGSNLVVYDAQPGATSTTVKFQVYGPGLQLISEHAVEVPGVKGKYMMIEHVQARNDQPVFFEFILREKMMSSAGAFVRVSNTFQLLSQRRFAKEDVPAHPDNAFFNRESFPIPPQDHLSGIYGLDGMDARLDNGSMIYMLTSRVGYYPNVNDDVTNLNKTLQPELIFFEEGATGYRKKWVFPVNEKQLLGYKVFASGNVLFLYTTYLLEGDYKKKVVTEQRIRRIDPDKGTLLYEKVITAKDGFEFMLSAMCFDSTSNDLVFAGNYMTCRDHKHWDEDNSVNSFFYLGKLDDNGQLTLNESSLEISGGAQLRKNLMRLPYFRVRQLVRLHNGSYMAAGQYCFGVPDEAYAHQDNAAMISDATRWIVYALRVVTFDASLKVSVIKDYPMKTRSVPHVYQMDGQDPRGGMLGTLASDRSSGFDSFWFSATETLVMIQYDADQNGLSNRPDLYAARWTAGQETAFSLVRSNINNDNMDSFLFRAGYIIGEYSYCFAERDAAPYQLVKLE